MELYCDVAVRVIFSMMFDTPKPALEVLHIETSGLLKEKDIVEKIKRSMSNLRNVRIDLSHLDESAACHEILGACSLLEIVILNGFDELFMV